MKKTRKLILIFGVALILFAPLAGLVPLLTSGVSAVNDTIESGSSGVPKQSTAEIEAQLKSYIYMRAVADCIDDMGSGATVLSDNATNWEFFDSDDEVIIGMFDGGDNNGEKQCGDSWVKEAYGIWGFTDPITAVCYSGYKRVNSVVNDGGVVTTTGTGDTAKDCIEGTGNLKLDGDVDDAIRQFKKNINNQYYDIGYSTSWPSMTEPMQYMYYRYSFEKLCHATRSSALDEVEQASIDGNSKHYRLTDSDGTTQISFKAEKTKTTKVETRQNESQGEVEISCGDLAKNASKYALAYSVVLPEGDDGSLESASGATESGAIGAECGGFEDENLLSFALSWVFCPVISATMAMANAMEDSIAGMLCINESDIFGTEMTCTGEQGSQESRDAFKSAWNVFRILALGLLAIGGLVMVFSQALGFEIFDAYTIKKVLPRILIAAIGITLSWQLLEFVVTFSNALGIGVRALIYQPFLDAGINTVVLEGGSAALGLLLSVGSFFVLGPLGLLSFVGTAALALFIAFFILVVRNILVILLVIVAPIAIAAYILPNTAKYWNIWWDWFFKALLAFPIITALIAVGHVFAAITSARSDSTFSAIVAFVAYFAPYFLIPAAFRFAGGALATIGGFANDRGRGGFDRLKKFRGDQSEKRMGYYGQQIGDRTAQRRAQMVRSLNASASGRGRFAGGAMRLAGRQIGGLGGIEPTMSAINARTAKQINDQIATGKDDDIRGLTVNRRAADLAKGDLNTEDGNGLKRIKDGRTQYKSLGGAWIDQSDVENGHKKWGNDVAAQQAALSYEMRKAMTDEDVKGISDRYGSLATNEWGQTDIQAGGSWIGAGFENQNQHVEYKNTNWKNGKLDAEKFSKELYEKKGSYQLSQMSAHTMKRMKEAYDVGDTDTKQRIQAVAETFMYRGGANPGGISNVDEEGNVLRTPPAAGDSAGGSTGTRGDIYQTTSQGSGHVAEAVRDMAVHVGVYRPESGLGTPKTESTGPPPTIPRQN